MADRITVMRSGEYVATKKGDEVAPNDLVEMMIGKKIEGNFGYTLEIKFTSTKKQQIPNQLKAKLDTILKEIDQELNDRVEKIFDEYEMESVG